MKTNQRKPSGAFGWLAIFALATVYDVYAIKTNKVETLSRAFWRWNKHSYGGLITAAIWASISFHLLIDNPLRHVVEELLSGPDQ